jgi:hypothetical protein
VRAPGSSRRSWAAGRLRPERWAGAPRSAFAADLTVAADGWVTVEPRAARRRGPGGAMTSEPDGPDDVVIVRDEAMA